MAETPSRKQTWRGLERRWETLGFDGLDPSERETIALFWLDGEVMNGGLVQYFSNSSGDLAPLAVAALDRLGATRTLQLLAKSMEKLCPGGYCSDRERRHVCLATFAPHVDPFEAETTALQDRPEDFFGMALDDLSLRYERNA